MTHPLFNVLEEKVYFDLTDHFDNHRLKNIVFSPVKSGHSLCCIHLQLEQSPSTSEKIPSGILFEVMGQIAIQDCYLTTHGDSEHYPEPGDGSPAVSCWIEPLPDILSCADWRKAMRAITKIAEMGPESLLHLLRHVRMDPPSIDFMQLQVGWRPRASEDMIADFPLFNRKGKQTAPTSISEVPFGKPVQTVLAQLKSSLAPLEKRNFEAEWAKKVERQCEAWKRARVSQSQYAEQLEWEAHVVEYVNFVHERIKAHGNAKLATERSLRRDLPLYGPRFVPPTYLDIAKRSATPEIMPETTYLKPVTIVHPFYFPEITQCPQCDSGDVKWIQWAATGHREVHGLFREETAIGYQLRCKECEKRTAERSGTNEDSDGAYCFTTTSHLFWQRRDHWEIPSSIPYFLRRCAVTRELFDLIVELRPSTTSAGLAENVRQLHLLEYHRERLVYLRYFQLRQETKNMSLVDPPPLRKFSKPGEIVAGYCDRSITDDLITDIFNKFSEKTRQPESETYLRTLSATSISLDNTFRAAGKASLVTVVEKKQNRIKVLKGGILSVINEVNEIISWRFCQSQSTSEIAEVLAGLKRRGELLQVPDPVLAVVDNCCHVRKSIKKALPEIDVVLDVWHFVGRYLACIIGGTKNSLRGAVARDLVGAILKTTADKYNRAVYWSRAEQER
ncbi:hypothetical protein SCP_0412720 [Sparassis crispa]|uniref:Uncharacterized protein n=1 Tax=Sparassis crispa TaxID=139825 RepID=A0A401GL35_9APHY|nr:hypothetical protein SCP_0412720 [Sparassis crispa]GBE82885.1 hypothetical protein SCP_0412720 [Sparassis crispa]